MRIFALIAAQCFVLCWTLTAQSPVPFSNFPQPKQYAWNSPESISELKLLEAQVNQITQAVDAYKGDIAAINSELAKRRELLNDLMREDPMDEAKVTSQWNLVEETRAAQEKRAFQLRLAARKICPDRAQWAKLMSRLSTSVAAAGFTPDPNVRPPRAIVQPMPGYTDEARANRIEGTILLQVTIHKDGTATVSRVLRGLGYGLDKSAIETIEKKWRWEPGTSYGEPVETSANIEVRFRLY